MFNQPFQAIKTCNYETEKESEIGYLKKARVFSRSRIHHYPDIVIDVGIGIDDPVPYFPEGNKPEKLFKEDTLIVDFPDKNPEFPGGTAALFQYLHDHIKYPSLAGESNIQETVYVYFVVERDGSITNVKVVRPVGGGCDEEAVRVVRSMPRWKPGLQHGRPVRVSFNLPIKFVLL